MIKFSITLITLLALAVLGNCIFRHKAVMKEQTMLTGEKDSLVVDFQMDVVPILKARCSPCHFPDGKMYSKMPFDEPKTIRDHPEGILKRIKAEEENRKIAAFLNQE